MPSAVLVTEAFVNLAAVSMKGAGMASAPMVVLPPTQRTEYGTRSEMEEIGEKALEQAISMLMARV